MRPAANDSIRRELDAAVSILSKAHEQGATLIAGSESGFAMTPYGQWHTREMELFVSHLGMTDMRALLCMTRDAAVAVPGHSAMIGTLTRGKYADMLIVDGRPDEDVSVLADRRRLRVIKGGARSSRGGLTRRRLDACRSSRPAPTFRPCSSASGRDSTPGPVVAGGSLFHRHRRRPGVRGRDCPAVGRSRRDSHRRRRQGGGRPRDRRPDCGRDRRHLPRPPCRRVGRGVGVSAVRRRRVPSRTSGRPGQQCWRVLQLPRH